MIATVDITRLKDSKEIYQSIPPSIHLFQNI